MAEKAELQAEAKRLGLTFVTRTTVDELKEMIADARPASGPVVTRLGDKDEAAEAKALDAALQEVERAGMRKESEIAYDEKLVEEAEAYLNRLREAAKA